MPDLEKRARCVPRRHPTRDPVSDLLPVPVPLVWRLGARDRALLEPLGLHSIGAIDAPRSRRMGSPLSVRSCLARTGPGRDPARGRSPRTRRTQQPDAPMPLPSPSWPTFPPPPRLVCHLEPIRVRRGPARWSGVRQASVEDQAELRSRCTDRAEKAAKKAHRSQCPTDRVRYNESSVRPCMRSSRFRKCLSKGPGTARRRGA